MELMKNDLFDMVIHWKVTDYCNFSCPGCSGQAIRLGPNRAPKKINLSALKKFLHKLQKTVKIIITGGEPFLIENMVDVCAEIARRHYLVMITNLSSPRIRDFADRLDPARVILIKASTHLQQLERNNLLTTYIEHFRLLQSKGFNLLAEEVAYPILAEKADGYRQLFMDNGITLQFQAYRGQWQNKKYPESYTAEEAAIFKFTDINSGSAAMHNRKNTLCNAGYNAVVAYRGGQIYPCYHLLEPLGHIYKKVKLNKQLINCPLDYCDCPLSVFDPQLFARAIAETQKNGNGEQAVYKN